MTGSPRVALVGAPNSGKSALFNRLTGARAKVANYPGVTVERRVGVARDLAHETRILDLPGTYALATDSPDEAVTLRALRGEFDHEPAPDAVIAVVDATRLNIGLRLVRELALLQLPMIVAVNVIDEAAKRGIIVDLERMASMLGCPVVSTVAVRRDGIDDLLPVIDDLLSRSPAAGVEAPAPELPTVDALLDTCVVSVDAVENPSAGAAFMTTPMQRRLDRIVLHPIFGPLLLLTVLFGMFQAVFVGAAPLISIIESLIQGLGDRVADILPAGPLTSLIVDGVIAGTGAVLVFLPQILILFACISLLEDSGYLPRASLLLDAPMRVTGLSGRSFIPLLSSFACAVPGIMSTRSISDARERLTTIMIAPLIPCSARLPVYTMLVGACIPSTRVWGIIGLQGLVLFVLYASGVAAAAALAWVMSFRHARRGHAPSSLLIELPSYRWPRVSDIVTGLRQRTRIFLRRVGTIVLAATVLMWMLSSWPQPAADAATAAAAIDASLAGRLGHVIQPLFAPLGFSWQMCVALIPAMAAREVAIGALATVYSVSAVTVGGAGMTLGSALHDAWSLPAALAFLAWFIFAPQCLATIATIRRETASRRTTTMIVATLFAMAWCAALLTNVTASALIG